MITDSQCPETYDEFHCRLAKGHSGNHVCEQVEWLDHKHGICYFRFMDKDSIHFCDRVDGHGGKHWDRLGFEWEDGEYIPF